MGPYNSEVFNIFYKSNIQEEHAIFKISKQKLLKSQFYFHG